MEIEERERYRVKMSTDQIKEREKTLVFCATQRHAGLVRHLINQMDGALLDQWLRTFQDNEKTIPTILTTTTKAKWVKAKISLAGGLCLVAERRHQRWFLHRSRGEFCFPSFYHQAGRRRAPMRASGRSRNASRCASIRCLRGPFGRRAGRCGHHPQSSPRRVGCPRHRLLVAWRCRTCLLDHLVGAGEQHRRQIERPR